MSVPVLHQPGPQPIDNLNAFGPRVSLGDRLVRRDWLVQRWSETHERVATVTRVAVGEWDVEWPDLTSTPEAPTVANIVEVGIAHWSSLFGSVLPSFRVPINASAERSEAKRGARKRERRLRQLIRKCNLSEAAASFGGDYAGAGYAVGLVWADFGEPDPAKRDPYIMRIDPRHVFLTKDNLGNITELLVARKISKQELLSMWGETNPDYVDVFDKSNEEDVEEWFWIDKDSFYHAIVDTSTKGRQSGRYVVLADVDNQLGFVPAAECLRPSFDGQRRGHFDQTIHILRTMHRLMVMTIHSTEEHSYPMIAAFDVANAGDFGPGAVLELMSPEAKVDIVGPTNHFDVKDLVARLGEEVRMQSALPQQLFGEMGASIVSARGINAAMGQLDARLAVAHQQFEHFYSQLYGFMLAMDEVYCDGEKTIVGDSEEDTVEKYRPSRDVNGAWIVECTYGLGAGSDPANTEMRLHMHLNGGLISRETARRELPFLEDPDGEELKVFRQTMLDAFQQAILAQATTLGDPTLAAEALKLLRTDDVDFEEVIEKLVEFITTPPEEAPADMMGGTGAEEAVMGMESMARGGIPGNAEQAPTPNLPPLGQIMGGPTQVL